MMEIGFLSLEHGLAGFPGRQGQNYHRLAFPGEWPPHAAKDGPCPGDAQ